MKVLIAGGGKIGYYLARALAERGSDVVIIEKERALGESLANDLSAEIIWGDATKLDVLESAGVSRADAVIAVTGRDEDNLVVCQLAKKLHSTEKTIAKVNNPKNVATISALGIDHVISATDSIIDRLEREVDDSRIRELVELDGGGVTVLEVRLPENYALSGERLSEMRLPESFNIISITRGGEFLIPRGKTRLVSEDKLLIAAAGDAVEDVRRALKLSKAEVSGKRRKS